MNTALLCLIFFAAPGEFSNHLDFSTDAENVEQAARRFRIATYEQFREDRAEYERRIALGDELLGQWSALDTHLDAEDPGRHLHESKCLEWFAATTDPSRAGNVLAPLPELPAIETFAQRTPAADHASQLESGPGQQAERELSIDAVVIESALPNDDEAPESSGATSGSPVKSLQRAFVQALTDTL